MYFYVVAQIYVITLITLIVRFFLYIKMCVSVLYMCDDVQQAHPTKKKIQTAIKSFCFNPPTFGVPCDLIHKNQQLFFFLVYQYYANIGAFSQGEKVLFVTLFILHTPPSPTPHFGTEFVFPNSEVSCECISSIRFVVRCLEGCEQDLIGVSNRVSPNKIFTLVCLIPLSSHVPCHSV